MTAMSDAYELDWVRQFCQALKKGGQPTVEVLDDGRVRVATEYPSLDAAMAVWRDLEALKAMATEDARALRQAQEDEEELVKVVRDYHNGDD